MLVQVRLLPIVQIPEEGWGRRGGMVMHNPYDGPQFLLFYTMIGSQIINSMGKWAIGLATSDDGLQWTRLGDKPIIEGQWSAGGGAGCMLPACLFSKGCGTQPWACPAAFWCGLPPVQVCSPV